ncbi:hypothetical protein CRE_16663 [Caenorhabditis remanei]|uniref:Uncharacterized protein n=1 Tax=Caenorhabditis remanei TaxID=31234 RepID=E3MAZ7_CAERE|nr:hypothetical protein CRE_16663 [Caenorhabditis remanei]
MFPGFRFFPALLTSIPEAEVEESPPSSRTATPPASSPEPDYSDSDQSIISDSDKKNDSGHCTLPTDTGCSSESCTAGSSDYREDSFLDLNQTKATVFSYGDLYSSTDANFLDESDTSNRNEVCSNSILSPVSVFAYNGKLATIEKNSHQKSTFTVDAPSSSENSHSSSSSFGYATITESVVWTGRPTMDNRLELISNEVDHTDHSDKHIESLDGKTAEENLDDREVSDTAMRSKNKKKSWWKKIW